LIFFCRLKFADDDLVQLLDGPMRYRFPAHGPTKTLILVLDQSTLVPYFYGFDPCFLRVRSFGITHWLVRSPVFNRRPPTLLPVAKSLSRDARNVLAKGTRSVRNSGSVKPPDRRGTLNQCPSATFVDRAEPTSRSRSAV
jgi:hypothetical protein